jgi:chromosome transmission fidelity protein 18
MADIQVETFGPNSLLQIEETVDADIGHPGVEDFVPNGLLGCHLAKEPSSSNQDTPSHFTLVAPPSPFRPNGLFNSPNAEPGAYKCNLSDSLCLIWMSRRRDRIPSTALSRRDMTTFNRTCRLTLCLDDDLPDIADVLKSHPRARASADNAASTSSTPIILPRPSLRSSTFDGKTIFLKRKSRVIGALVHVLDHKPQTQLTLAPIFQRPSAHNKTMRNLLCTPIHRLMDELSATTAQRLMHADVDSSPSSGRSSRPEETLWVDRYRPKRFTDLLGDERVHREVLAWVKQWDLCVFGKGKGKRRARDGESFLDSEDELGRPQEKVRFLRELGVSGFP